MIAKKTEEKPEILKDEYIIDKESIPGPGIYRKEMIEKYEQLAKKVSAL